LGERNRRIFFARNPRTSPYTEGRRGASPPETPEERNITIRKKKPRKLRFWLQPSERRKKLLKQGKGEVSAGKKKSARQRKDDHLEKKHSFRWPGGGKRRNPVV